MRARRERRHAHHQAEPEAGGDRPAAEVLRAAAPGPEGPQRLSSARVVDHSPSTTDVVDVVPSPMHSAIVSVVFSFRFRYLSRSQLSVVDSLSVQA